MSNHGSLRPAAGLRFGFLHSTYLLRGQDPSTPKRFAESAFGANNQDIWVLSTDPAANQQVTSRLKQQASPFIFQPDPRDPNTLCVIEGGDLQRLKRMIVGIFKTYTSPIQGSDVFRKTLATFANNGFRVELPSSSKNP